MVAKMVKKLPTVWKDLYSVPGLGRSPGEGNGYLSSILGTCMVAQTVKNKEKEMALYILASWISFNSYYKKKLVIM